MSEMSALKTTNNYDDFFLKEISPEDAFQKRFEKEVFSLIKEDGGLYYVNSSIDYPRNHLCWNCSNAYPEKCAKFRDTFPLSHHWSIRHCRLEKYDFIISGFEIINCKVERLVVTKCENFSADEPSRKFSKAEKDSLKLALLRNLVPEAKTLSEGKELVRHINERNKQILLKEKEGKKTKFSP